MRELLDRVPLFAALPAIERAALESELRLIDYPAGVVLWHEGEHGDRVYIVLTGSIAIVKAMDTPDARLLAVRGVGEFVGEMSLLDPDGLRTASARVVADVKAFELTRADFDELLQRHPTVAYSMLRILSARLRDSHEGALLDMQEQNRRLAESYAALQEKNRQLAEAYTELEAAQTQIVAKETLERELQLAREIQESILPRMLPRLPGLDLGAWMLPAREVAGDFFDVIQLGEDALGLVIGDVCGKGMPSAIFMALTRSLLRAEASRAISPEAALRSVNRHLEDMNAAGMFVTILYGILRPSTCEFTYARAGHELPLVWDAAGVALTLPRANGIPLGLLPDPALDTQTVCIPAGGTLLLFTDGVTEADNAQGQFFGLERVDALVRARRDRSAQALCDDLVETLRLYRGTAPQADDITVVALRLGEIGD